MNMLSIDWDFFFEKLEDSSQPEFMKQWGLYDWGHKEAPFFINGPLWTVRAGAFIRHNIPLPMTTGDEETFWGGFKFAKNAKLHIAESHSSIGHLLSGGNNIWSYDAHHDMGYEQIDNPYDHFDESGEVSCDNWALLSHLYGTNVHIRYPRWRHYAMEFEPIGNQKAMDAVDRQVDDGSIPNIEFDTVFLCRSGAWTPPWVDEQFFNFVDMSPVKKKNWLDKKEALERHWDIEQAEKIAKSTQAFLMNHDPAIKEDVHAESSV
jgi:hypothetical protein